MRQVAEPGLAGTREQAWLGCAADDLHARGTQALAYVLTDRRESFGVARRSVGHLQEPLELEERSIRRRGRHRGVTLGGSSADGLDLAAQQRRQRAPDQRRAEVTQPAGRAPIGRRAPRVLAEAS